MIKRALGELMRMSVLSCGQTITEEVDTIVFSNPEKLAKATQSSMMMLLPSKLGEGHRHVNELFKVENLH